MALKHGGNEGFSGFGRLIASVVAPLPPEHRRRRVAQLLAGLFLYGLSDSMLVLSGLGLDPWDVFQQGLAQHSSVTIGTWSILVGLGVLALWIPLRQRPGFGTLANVVLIGSTMNLVLALAPVPHGWVRWPIMVSAVALNGVATGCYIGAGLGPGPRDGLMVGIAARGQSIRVVRTLIEATVLLIGWLLGGRVGFGTLAYALAIGPLAHIMIPRFTVLVRQEGRRARRLAEP